MPSSNFKKNFRDMFPFLWYNRAVPDSRDRIAPRLSGRKKEIIK